ncbi:MAG: GtrA family protein [Clostridia bacterium]|nr:GtrA family protein [Clostridia bacterium]
MDVVAAAVEILKKYKSYILYLAFGAGTTLINLITYQMCYYALEISNVNAVIFAWLAAVMFAFVTNKLWVFESKRTGSKIIKECITFFSCRMLTGIFDLLIMYYAVDVFEFDAFLWKLISNIAVIVLNYLAGRFVVFKKVREDIKVQMR